VLGFGADSDVKITHNPDVGLYLKSTATADDNPFVLTLQTGETAISGSDVLGAINFQAPDEADGSNAILVGAAIEAVAEGTFDAGEIHTKLVFKTASDAAPAERLSISSGGYATFSSGATFGSSISATYGYFSGDVYANGNELYFGNGESISNATNGDFLFKTSTQTGALTLKNTNSSSGIASLELVSDNAGNVGDGYEVKSLNGTFTITSDHSSSGTYNDTYFTISGNSTPASSTTTIAGGAVVAGSGGLDVSGGVITLANDETISNATNGTVAITATTTSVSGDLTVTGNDITFGNGESISNGTDGTITINGNVDFSDKQIAGYGATIQTLSSTSLTLDNDDNGTIINVTTTSGPITIQVPSGLATGFNCMIVQSGDETVTLDDNSDATTLNNRNGLKTAGQYAIVTLVHIGSNVYVVSGDTKSS
jgi:hypothetical protein